MTTSPHNSERSNRAPALPGTGRSRMPGLDGLRAIAVLSVIVYHATPGALVGGYLGVDVFFVISGFLITGLLVREHEGTGIRFGGFWLRRARRLLPALVVLLLVCSSAALLVGGDVLLRLGSQVIGALTFSSNWVFIAAGSSYFDASAPELFRNLWSLAVEEQFYLLWPIVVILLTLVPARWARESLLSVLAIGSAVAMALTVAPGTDATRAYYGTDTHAFGLALGSALAVLAAHWSPVALEWRRSVRAVLPAIGTLALAGILLLAAVMPADTVLPYRGGLALVAVLSALVIVGSITPGSWLGAALDTQPLRWIGERSYGFYLWHWPVVVLLAAAYPRVDDTPGGAWAIGGIAVAITFVAASVSFRFVEQPIRRRGFRAAWAGWRGAWRRGWVPALAAGASAVLLVTTVTTTGIAIARDPGKSSLQLAVEAGEAAIREAEQHPPAPPPVDEPPALPGGDQILAIGDSVMLAAAPSVQAAFPGIAIDAVVSRQMKDAPAIVRAAIAKGALRPILILGLGTNGWIDAATLEEVRALVGTEILIVVVNIQAPRDWEPDVNAILASFAQRYRTVDLANWHDAIQPRLDVLSSDNIHPGGPIGGSIYASSLRDALQRLAELPPILRNNEFDLVPRPV